jgi:para-aminobenzoate synthetase component 1
VPFAGILKTGDFSIISGSPERFLRYDGDFVVTRPMKGTRRRSQNEILDRKFKNELQDSAKDKAELLMIVDLERNDLGKVCDYGSVKVESLRNIEEYNTVFQATSQIKGRLYPGMDRVDIIKACFPGGSITGCPKIRAMQIIEELEPNRRGIYTGSMGYFGFNGTMDFNILIRSFFKMAKDVYFSVGGGIVYDSKPQSEYEETLVKAEALKRALKGYKNEAVCLVR